VSPRPLVELTAHRLEAERWQRRTETLAEETAVAMVYNGHSHVVMMATPADLDDFAFGFALTEGIVAQVGEVEMVDRLETGHGVSLQMLIPQARFEALNGRERQSSGRTGCGLCGTATLEAAIRPVRPVDEAPILSPEALFDALRRLQTHQPFNERSGAVHAAALIDDEGALRVREDVGRHNAIDKVAGALLRAGRHPQALLVTSRASYEVVHKAAQIGCPMVVAISAPTALAVRLAEQAGVVLAGFARDSRMTVYAGASRFRGPG